MIPSYLFTIVKHDSNIERLVELHDQNSSHDNTYRTLVIGKLTKDLLQAFLNLLKMLCNLAIFFFENIEKKELPLNFKKN